MNQKHQVLANAKIKRRQPDDRLEPARCRLGGILECEGLNLTRGKFPDAPFLVGI
jgi:hypothetical protein